ncbi:MAG: peptidylprolyl isomerase [Candidatus Kerfeldbacteria bacterium]|nr:peptidylprolyl isomerase [Candidatus Kerfeldbacteria bacterium]
MPLPKKKITVRKKPVKKTVVTSSPAPVPTLEDHRLDLKNKLRESLAALQPPTEPAGDNITKWRQEVLQEISEAASPSAARAKTIATGPQGTPATVRPPLLPPTKKAPPAAPRPLAVRPIIKVHLPVGQPSATKPVWPVRSILPSSAGKKFKGWLVLLMPLVFVMVSYLAFYLIRLDRVLPGVARYLPWPAVYVNGQFVSWRTLNDNLSGLALFYEQDLKQNGFKQPNRALLETLAFKNVIHNTLVRQILKQNRINTAFNPRLWLQDFVKPNFASSEALLNFVQAAYGWDTATLNHYVIEPYLERTALEQFLKQDKAGLAQARARIQALRQLLLDGQLTFAEAARKQSEDELTSGNGGSLGWFTLDTLSPDLAVEFKKLKANEISQPILTNTGYHLFQLNKARDGEIQASHILIKVLDFDKWLEELQQKAIVIKLIRI